MHHIRSAHSRIRQHFFQIYIDAPQGVPGVSKNSQNMLQIKVLSSWPFGSQKIKNAAFRFELFSFQLPLWYPQSQMFCKLDSNRVTSSGNT